MNIDINYMLKMELNSIIKFDTFNIQRVPGGWVYCYIEYGKITSSVYVSGDEVLLQKVSGMEQKVKELKKPFNNGFHIDWIVDWKDKNTKYHSKHYKFNNESHKNNWERIWTEKGNKIIGWHKADALGNLINQ